MQNSKDNSNRSAKKSNAIAKSIYQKDQRIILERIRGLAHKYGHEASGILLFYNIWGPDRYLTGLEKGLVSEAELITEEELVKGLDQLLKVSQELASKPCEIVTDFVVSIIDHLFGDSTIGVRMLNRI